MAGCELVVGAYTGLRNSLSNCAMPSQDAGDRNILLHRAMVSGNLAEQCDAKFSGREIAHGDTAIGQANTATALADAANGDHDAILATIASAEQANATLAGIVGSSLFGVSTADTLVGSLRITPSRRALARANGNFAAADAQKPRTATPGYVTDVAKLFPVEAATVFPLGQTIAGDNQVMLLIVIAMTALFTVALRYFATQEDGKVSWNEIGGALISLLLWIGATKGYWVAGKGFFDPGITPTQGASLFGFVTVIWVALAPYLVKAKAKRDAGK